jgi:branched-chain amino acid transport system ATP-binding protein
MANREMTRGDTLSDLLAVSGLGKSFDGVRAVDDLSFSVSKGTIVGLIGPNGSGKSTTIDCISGFTRADCGRVRLDGGDISTLSPERVAAAGLLRTFQNVRVYERMTLLENLLISRQAFDRLGWLATILETRELVSCEDRARKRALELLGLVGLSKYAVAPSSILSYGQKKLLAFAMALMGEPKLVVLDEPLAGVNPSVIRDISTVIQDLNRQGQTFLIIEHNVGFIMEHCHKVVVMEQGRKIADGSASVIREDDRVLQAYLGSADALAKELAYHGQ